MKHIEQEIPMPIEATRSEALSLRLGIFRPSDRKEFEKAFKTKEGSKAAYEAVVQYVEIWEQADWIEEYTIERIGKWMAKKAPSKLCHDLKQWAKQNDSLARKALLSGIAPNTQASKH